MPSLWGAFGSSTKVPINTTTFVWYVLPPMICYLVAAALAVKPQTHAARITLWPIVCLLAFRAVICVDMSPDGFWQKVFNSSLVHYMSCVVIRTFDWTLSKEPLVRHTLPPNTTSSTILDVLDLVTSMRGLGWNWSHGLSIPHETRPADRIPFASYAFISAAEHAFVCGVLHRAILSFLGAGPTANGPSIFDASLPLLLRYLRASIISIFTGFVAYASMQMSYDLCIIPAVLFFGQHPTQWAPSFHAPWRATSLSEFWGRRWHQWNRRLYLLLGGYPLSLFFGRAGMILGTFLASAVMHDMVLLSINSRVEFWRMLVGFGMMGPGLLAERAFYKLTGKRVEGAAGWIWMMTWLVLSGIVMTEGLARAEVFGDHSLIDSVVPVRMFVERSVVEFDRWLHVI